MSTFNAFYVRKQAADDAIRAGILKIYPNARIEASADFVGAILSRDDLEAPEQALARLSADLGTDVIWVTFQTTAESFIFHHWRAGSQLRVLNYGCAHEGTWDRAEGQAEPWEKEAFWSQDDLESSLECAETEAERRKVDRLWHEAVIRKGESHPSISSTDAVQAVMAHYGLSAGEATVARASPEIKKRGKSKLKYGCLLVLLFLVAVCVLAVIGIVKLLG